MRDATARRGLGRWAWANLRKRGSSCSHPHAGWASVWPMITVGCAGFPVPATRYFKEFSFVEVQETHLSLPGRGTIRRWRREAPSGFRFALLGPRNVGQEGFRVGKVTETALESIEGVADALQARTAVFVAPAEFTQT